MKIDHVIHYLAIGRPERSQASVRANGIEAENQSLDIQSIKLFSVSTALIVGAFLLLFIPRNGNFFVPICDTLLILLAVSVWGMFWLTLRVCGTAQSIHRDCVVDAYKFGNLSTQSTEEVQRELSRIATSNARAVRAMKHELIDRMLLVLRWQVILLSGTVLIWFAARWF